MPLTYDQRLRTFTAWPHNSPSASEMAAAGFIFIGENPRHYHSADAVQCLDCGLQVEAWFPGYVPFAEHAKWEPDCPFVMAHQKAARKGLRAATTQSSATAYRNGKVLFTPHTPPLSPAKPCNLAKRDVEDLKSWKEEGKMVGEQRNCAVADLAAEKEAHKKALQFWNAEAENANAGAADVLAEKEALNASQTTEMHELKTQLQALTTSIIPLQAAIEGLTTAISQLQSDKLTIHHESSSDVDTHTNHAGAVRHNSNKEPLDADSLSSAGESSDPSDRFETADLNEADVTTGSNSGNFSTGHPDAEEGGSRGPSRNEEDDNINGAGVAEDSLRNSGLSDDDSWSNLESVSPSSDGGDGVGSD